MATRNVVQAARKAGLATAQHITLKNIPRTATPRDLEKFLSHSQAQGVSKYAILYDSAYNPTGSALLTLAMPNFLKDNIRVLHNSFMAGRMIHAQATEKPEISVVPDNSGKHVIVSGLPYVATPQLLKQLSEGFELDGNNSEYKVQPVTNQVLWQTSTRFSRYLLRFASPAEAQRFVRTKHQTILPNTSSNIYTHVVYGRQR